MKSFVFKTEWMELIKELPLIDQAIAFQAIVQYANMGEKMPVAENVAAAIEPVLENIRVQNERRLRRNEKARERRRILRKKTQEPVVAGHTVDKPVAVSGSQRHPRFTSVRKARKYMRKIGLTGSFGDVKKKKPRHCVGTASEDIVSEKIRV